MKNYGRIWAIRACGIDRRLSLTGKVVFSGSTDIGTRTKTLIILPDIKSKYDLSDEDMDSILKIIGIEDDPRKVKWSTHPLITVKDPRSFSKEYWYYDLDTGFSFRDEDIYIQRSLDTSEQSPNLVIIKGQSTAITKADIEKDKSAEILGSLVGVIIVVAFFALLSYLAQ